MGIWLNRLGVGLAVFLVFRPAFAEIRPEKVHVADHKKNKFYVRDGLVIGGDRAIDSVIVKDIRRAVNPGFERIVIDLEGNVKGESAGIPRPPYFQLAVSPECNTYPKEGLSMGL